MRRLVIDTLLAVLAAGVLVSVVHGVATAGTTCQVNDPQTGKCLVWVEVPGTPGSPGAPVDAGPPQTGSGTACFWDGMAQGTRHAPPGPLDCTSQHGYWSNALGCYVHTIDPAPPAGDPVWQGHSPGDGAVYACYLPQVDLMLSIFWAQDPPPASGSGPTPGEVARLAIDDMELRAIDIGIAPRPGDGVGLVGMPVWLWAAGPGDHTWGPITASASAGGMTVTATAKVHAVVWDMGDGTKVHCASPGTPYQSSYGRSPSPDCGHTYQTSSAGQPGDRFRVSATSQWVIEWEGAGQTGTIRLNGLVREAQIAIGEAQVLVQ